jgi:hypothetical protein
MEGLASRGERQSDQPLRRAGWNVLWLLVPHIALGTFLAVVPDRTAFVVAQLTTALHVALAVFTLPVLLWWATRHAVRMRASRPRHHAPASVIQWSLAVAGLAACATGVAALWSGRGMPAGRVHALAGTVLAVPVALHLFAGGRRLAGALVVGGLTFGIAGLSILDATVKGEPEQPVTPELDYLTRPEALYDPAEWCGECHTDDYAEWKRSLHRTGLFHVGFQQDLGRRASKSSLELDIEYAGGAIRRHETLPVVRGRITPSLTEGCHICHAPATFYGRGATKPVEGMKPGADGISCSFCHTIRAVATGGHLEAALAETRASGRMPVGEFAANLAWYVSAPETVRRYLGQNSANPLLHALGNWLIRWRPQMHAHDYASPILATSEVCAGCHGFANGAPSVVFQAYPVWRTSRYAQDGVQCQDCHMARAVDGGKRREPGAHVPWGPIRPQRRSHLFVGGNTSGAQGVGDADLRAREHALNAKAVTGEVQSVRLAPAGLDVLVRVRNAMAGHDYPPVESQDQRGWLVLTALDAHGGVVARTPPPDEKELADGSDRIFERCLRSPFEKPKCDHVLPPDGELVVRTVLPLPAGPAPPSTVRVELLQTLDPDPVLLATAAVPASADE